MKKSNSSLHSPAPNNNHKKVWYVLLVCAAILIVGVISTQTSECRVPSGKCINTAGLLPKNCTIRGEKEKEITAEQTACAALTDVPYVFKMEDKFLDEIEFSEERHSYSYQNPYEDDRYYPAGTAYISARLGDDEFTPLWVFKNGTVVETLFLDNGADSFVFGLSRFVGNDGKIGLVNESGKVIVEPKYDALIVYEPDAIWFCNGCYRSYEIWDDDGHWTLSKRGQCGFLDFKGNIIFEGRGNTCKIDLDDLYQQKIKKNQEEPVYYNKPKP